MIIIESGIKCNIQVIQNYLKALNIDISGIPVTIKKGSWSLGSFGYYTKHSNIVNIVAYDSKWYYLAGGINASSAKKLLARLFGRGMTKDSSLANLAISKVIYHEWCHIHGIDQCRNDDKSKRYSCIMYENSWYQEIAAMPLQALQKFMLCDDCKKRLEVLRKENK